MARSALLLAAVLGLFAAASVAEETAPLVCEGAEVTASAEDPGLAALICETVRDHARRLTSCGLRQTRPVSVFAVEAIPNVPGNCVGAFYCDSDEIKVVLPERHAANTTPGFIYRGLDPLVTFASVVRHELAHAFLEQTTESRPVSAAGHEYVAYALQIDAMSPEDRATFLAHNGDTPAASIDIFNMLIAGLSPGAFAARAWIHFDEPENGCEFVRKIIDRHVVLGGYL